MWNVLIAGTWIRRVGTTCLKETIRGANTLITKKNRGREIKSWKIKIRKIKVDLIIKK